MIKIHPSIPTPLFNKMEEVCLKEDITITSLVIKALEVFIESKYHAKKPDPDTS